MRIIYTSDAIIPNTPAHTVHIMKMCSAFKKNGHEITLLTHDDKSIDADPFEFYGISNKFNIVKFKCPGFSGGALYYALLCLKYIKHAKPDIVYGRSLYTSWMVSRFSKIPLYYEIHNMINKNEKDGFFFKQLIKTDNLVRIVTISSSLAKEINRVWGINRDRILVAPDAADDVPTDNNIDIKLVNNIPDRNIGYIGHLYEGRGINIICDMARGLPNFSFHIVGGNADDVNRWKKETRDIKNIFFYGFVEPRLVAYYGMKFDYLLAPYQEKVICGTHGKHKSETAQWMSPLKIFEYLSYGKPIICSDIPVLHEVLKDRQNAILCSPNNPNEWISTIKKLEYDNRLRIDLSKNARRDFLNRYTWQIRAKKVISL